MAGAFSLLNMHPDHLPLIPPDTALQIFAAAELTDTEVAEQASLTRQAIFYWRRGRVANRNSRDRVSVLAYKALLGVRTRAFPLRGLNRNARRVLLRTFFDNASLSTWDATDLKSALPQIFNT